MYKSFLPAKDSELAIWLANYSNKIPTHGAVMGLTAAQIAEQLAFCNEMTQKIIAVEAKRDELKSAVQAKLTAYDTQLGALRAEIARLKTNPAYTLAIGNDLDVVSEKLPFDPATYKAQITGELFGGFVRIRFKKQGADGIDLYHRKKGDPAWLFLSRDTKSPYDDHISLADPTKPEHWEYRAYGILDDAEIGQPSDIVEVVFSV